MKKRQVQPIVPSACPADFIGLPYSPVLLLDAGFDSSVVSIPAFSQGCETGFGGYFDLIVHGCVEPHRWFEILRFMVDLVTDKECPSGFDLRSWLAWRAGYGLGWLSALALSQYQEASRGVNELTALFECIQDEKE